MRAAAGVDGDAAGLSAVWLLSSAYVHLAAGVLLTGYALFWGMLAFSLTRHADAEVERLLTVAGGARWPHVGLPMAMRLRFTSLGWIFLVVTAFTGVVVLPGAAFSGMLVGKLLLFVILLGDQLMLTLRPTPARAYGNLAVVLLIVAASALLRH
jgi:hypothetical protein